MARQARTIVLGAIAATLGIWWLGRVYEVESAALLRYLAASLVFVAVLILLAVGGAWLLRKLRRRRPVAMASRPQRAKPSAEVRPKEDP